MKKLYLFLLLLLGSFSTMAQSISTTYNSSTICTGQWGTFPVSYTSTGATFLPGNTFKVQLSNTSGSFATPITLATVTSMTTSGTIYVPVNSVAPGSGYRLRIVSSNPVITGSNNGSDITASPNPTVTITPAQSSICQGSSVQLSASGASTYSWMAWPDTSSLSATSGSVVTASPASTTYYTVMGTNAAGCSAYEMATVNVTPAAFTVNSNQPVCPGGVVTLWAWSNGAAATNVTWTGPNGFTATGNTVDIVNLNPTHYGTYTVTGNIGNCTGVTATINVSAPAGPTAYTSGTSFCPGSTIYLGADSVQNGATYSWVGPNGFTSTQMNPTIPNASTANVGTYSVYAVHPTCVSSPGTVQVNVSPTLTLTAGANVTLNQGNTILLNASGSSGNYQWTGPNGYTATGANPYIFNSTPAHSGNYTVTLASPGCPSVTDVMTVTVNPLNQITGTVYNDLNSNGVQDAGELGMPQVLVQVIPGYIYTTTDTLGNYSFNLIAGTYTVSPVLSNSMMNAVPGNYTVGFNGTGQISGSHDFGVFTTTFQDVSVWLTEVWNTAPGFTTKHRLSVKNWGTSPMSGTIKYLRDPLLTLNSNTSSGYTVSGDTLIWTYNNLNPGATTHRYAYMTVPAGTALGTAVTSSAWVTPLAGDLYPTNNTYTLNQTVVGSWDPNDKLVQPAGPITLPQAAAGTELIYTIRFQNTGTAPAVNVVVMDTLSDLLDLSTFQMISTSHSHQLNMRNPRILEFVFNNIMLPDSNTNEPASHGFIQYSIKPNANQVAGNVIENTAHIFFDFNEAIVTNTTQTELVMPSAADALADANALHLFPNPNSGSFNVKLTQATAGTVQIKLLNLLGQEVFTQTAQATGNTFESRIQASGLSNGIYLLQVQQNGKIFTKRLVLQQ